MPFGQAVGAIANQMGGANGGSFAQKQPMRPQMGTSIGGVNKPKLGSGGARQVTPQMGASVGNAVQPLQPAQGLSPSFARQPSANGLQDVASRMGFDQGGGNKPLIQTPPEGPPTQGYGQSAQMPPSNMAKMQPTGGVQMGARTQVGSMGSMNPNSGMMGGMARAKFGNMGRPGMAFQPQTPVEQGPANPIDPSNQMLQSLNPMAQAYMNRGMNRGQDMSWMNQPGALTPNAMEQQIMQQKFAANPNIQMGAAQSVEPDYGMGAIARPAVMPRTPEPMMEQGPSPEVQSGLGPSPEMMQEQIQPQIQPQRMMRGRRR